MKLALVQINPIVGDMPGNARLIASWARRAADGGADLIVFPELAVCGYPPRDLLLQEGFCEQARDACVRLCGELPRECVVMIGAPWKPGETGPASFDAASRPQNSVVIYRDGAIVERYDKRLLPTYDVFDEDRYFKAGNRPCVIDIKGVRIGVSVCEDLWFGDDVGFSSRYEGLPDPVGELVRAGARVIVNPSASPFALGKGKRQREILAKHVREHGVCVAAVNQVGGNDDLIFDGHAAVLVPDEDGGARLVAAGVGFEEAITMIELGPGRDAWSSLGGVPDPLIESHDMSLLWRALVLGVGDYCRKTGFRDAVIGLSGGIDSAVTAAVAAAALGADKVLGIGMPSRFSSPGSITDARASADALGLRFELAPVTEHHALMERAMRELFDRVGADPSPGVAEENIQSRLRGLILMAVSNKTGAILLTTGNKSELAVGYCTLYGDMNGGLAVLSDVSKVQVYALARWLNANCAACGFAGPPIPESSITKPPSAELRPDQTDQDTLPPYDMLDAIIARYVDQRKGVSTIVRETGFDPGVVGRVVRMIDLAEYKRKQMPIGLKVSPVAFGRGRRRPIVQRFRES
ncbi:MAG: NAD+ synthase [Phycisphaerales bacterium]|nr:NAD+ synthase [Phycisphaerales bacterium]